MITAKEALALYNATGHEADEFIEKQLQPKIIRAANEGKRVIFHEIDSCRQHYFINPDPLQRQVMKKMMELGYVCEIKKDGHPYVPEGLKDNYGEGELHVKYGFQIGW